MRRRERDKRLLDRLEVERDYWRRALFLEIEESIADETGAVSEVEMRARVMEHKESLAKVIPSVSI